MGPLHGYLPISTNLKESNDKQRDYNYNYESNDGYISNIPNNLELKTSRQDSPTKNLYDNIRPMKEI
jgi:hypothetical protein